MKGKKWLTWAQGSREGMETMVKLWLANTTSSPLRFSLFFFGKVSPSR
jgi:hypothetical protein